MKEKLIIDGYNLLKCRAFLAPSHLNLEAQRDHLIRILKSYTSQSGATITLVFDNSQKPPTNIIQSNKLKIIYCPPGKEADDIIKQMIRSEKNPSSVTIVTSDRAIRFSAKDHGVSNLTSEEFCRIMQSKNTSKSKKNTQSSQIHSVQSRKYGANISDKEVQFWKDLFEQGNADE